jgi:hypothetical protein
MSIELTLRSTPESGLLVPARLTESFGISIPRGRAQGSELRLAIDLSLDDAACATLVLDHVGQGRRVRSSAHGPGEPLLAWAFHAVAATTGAELFDGDGEQRIEPSPGTFRDAALIYLTRHEAGVEAARQGRVDAGGVGFLDWLAEEEHVALGGDARELAAALPMDDAVALYEMLLESDEVDDVFVSERELAGLLSRYRARFGHR